MAISEATIQEFQRILREDYGRDLTLAETSEIICTFVGYFDLLAKINFKNQKYERQFRESEKMS